MLNKEMTVVNKLGLHARAAAALVKLATTFDSSIQLVRDTHCVNGKSIMGVMMLAASQGTVLEVVVSGADEIEAMAGIEELFQSGFGEGS